jgi:hypothetical protein
MPQALVAGEAGIGKTAPVQEFCKQQSETRILWGACDALFTPRPLAPLHDIGRQTKGALLTAVNSGANRDDIFTAALEELEREKTLVVFEDMHWADEATLDLLKYLGRRIHRTHAMLAVTYRDDELGPRHPLRYVIGDLARASLRRMLLPPLSESAVIQLASLAKRPSKGLHHLTAGNPLFVTEVLAAAADTVPSTVRDAVLARALRLKPTRWRFWATGVVLRAPGRSWDVLMNGRSCSDGTGPNPNSGKLSRYSINWERRRRRRLCAGRCACGVSGQSRAARGHRLGAIHSA